MFSTDKQPGIGKGNVAILEIHKDFKDNGLGIVKAMDIKQNLPNKGDKEKFLTKLKREGELVGVEEWKL